MVRLHGLTGDGQSARTSGGITTLYPRGNVKWNEGSGYGWVYYDDERFPGANYDNALAKVTASLGGAECGQIIVYGFSNGGAMAAKMYCRGETLGGRVVGYVVDDPVTDAGVDGCAPAAGVKVAVFHSQYMDNQTKGNTQCRPGNSWICENNIRYLLRDYGTKIGTAGKVVAKDHASGPYEPVVASWWHA